MPDVEAKTIVAKIVKGPTPDGNEKNTWVDIELLEPGFAKPRKWRAFEAQNTIKEKAEWGHTYEWQVEIKEVENRRWPFLNIVGIGNEVDFPDVAPQATQTQARGSGYVQEDPDHKRTSIERQKSAELALQSFGIEPALDALIKDRGMQWDQVADPLFRLPFRGRVDYIHAAILGTPQNLGGGPPQNGHVEVKPEPKDAEPDVHMGVDDIKGFDGLMRFVRQERFPEALYNMMFKDVDTGSFYGWALIETGFKLVQEKTKCTWQELAQKMVDGDAWGPS